jgi:hypothetical protein
LCQRLLWFWPFQDCGLCREAVFWFKFDCQFYFRIQELLLEATMATVALAAQTKATVCSCARVTRKKLISNLEVAWIIFGFSDFFPKEKKSNGEIKNGGNGVPPKKILQLGWSQRKLVGWVRS